MHKSKSRYCYHICVSPGDAPGTITLNVVWMEREFDAYKLLRCMCPSNYYRFWDTAIYLWKKSSFYHTSLAFDAPIRGFPSEYRHPVWHGKTRMAWLPDGEKILKLCLFVLTQLMNVTDTRTHTAWQHMPRLCIASRGKKRNEQISMQTGTIGKREKGMKRSSSVSKGQRLWSQETGVRISSSGKGIIPDVLGSVVSVVD